MNSKGKVSLFTATSLVIASMIGTGIFTSLGFQVVDISSGFSILFLWMIGGIAAFAGAVCYAELGSIFPRSGGEYNLLSEIYHPSLGFLAGWVSATVGFAAPASLAAIAFASYLNGLYPGLPQQHIAGLILVGVTLIHAYKFRLGTHFQDVSTLLKVGLILFLIFSAFFLSNPQPIKVTPISTSWSEVISPAFAVSLVFVSYAYTGWNSAIYIIDDLRKPIQLSKALFIGTGVVMLLYIALNYVFLLAVPLRDLKGKIEIGVLAGSYLFGARGTLILSSIICILLLSTVSAYVFLGPRIMQVIGTDYRALHWLSKRSDQGIPRNAYFVSTLLSLSFIYFSHFEQILVYTSFLLILITSMTVAGVFVVRHKGLNAKYKAWGYPFTPAIFLGISIWTLVYVLVEKPVESIIGLAILALGMAMHRFVR